MNKHFTSLIRVFIVNYDKCNVSLLNKSIDSLKQWLTQTFC